MLDLHRTIAAISTPPGKGGVSLIRISGGEAFSIADKCFIPRYGEMPLSEREPRRAIRGDIIRDGNLIDDGMAIRFPAPHSYTGEDTVEFTCHGGVLVTRMVLETLYLLGAHPAEAGEFTRRAFLNGNLSLTDAEAIGGLLEATGEGQVKLANRESRDRLTQALGKIRASLVTLLGSLWANIDYPEEDLAELTDDELQSRLSSLLEETDKLLRTYRTGRAIQEGIPTAIVGKPNVGKSSLYNLLCLEDVAIVTDIAGTTRDVLERTVPLGDVTLRLFDTAGIRDTADVVEQIGVMRTREKMESAELVLCVFDASLPLDEEDLSLIRDLAHTTATKIAILNKADLGLADMTTLYEKFPHHIVLSSKTGDTEALSHLVKRLFTDGDIHVGEDAILSGARQFASLSRARDLMASTYDALSMGLPADVACSDLELALGAIGELDGREVSEDVVHHIFSHFCVGK